MKRGFILIAESDRGIAQETGMRVTAIGLQTLWVSNGREVVKNFIDQTPDAIILRDALPDSYGWETASPPLFRCGLPISCDRGTRV